MNNNKKKTRLNVYLFELILPVDLGRLGDSPSTKRTLLACVLPW